ncbi:hypothetical protein DL93DRAFT_2098231 [Clavulina sp. PMI_390]|nr:hypothetical protein DL93DRAFT_2098231 [Clavulina sp. PMI_390]
MGNSESVPFVASAKRLSPLLSKPLEPRLSSIGIFEESLHQRQVLMRYARGAVVQVSDHSEQENVQASQKQYAQQGDGGNGSVSSPTKPAKPLLSEIIYRFEDRVEKTRLVRTIVDAKNDPIVTLLPSKGASYKLYYGRHTAADLPPFVEPFGMVTCTKFGAGMGATLTFDNFGDGDQPLKLVLSSERKWIWNLDIDCVVSLGGDPVGYVVRKLGGAAFYFTVATRVDVMLVILLIAAIEQFCSFTAVSSYWPHSKKLEIDLIQANAVPRFELRFPPAMGSSTSTSKSDPSSVLSIPLEPRIVPVDLFRDYLRDSQVSLVFVSKYKKGTVTTHVQQKLSVADEAPPKNVGDPPEGDNSPDPEGTRVLHFKDYIERMQCRKTFYNDADEPVFTLIHIGFQKKFGVYPGEVPITKGEPAAPRIALIHCHKWGHGMDIEVTFGNTADETSTKIQVAAEEGWGKVCVIRLGGQPIGYIFRYWEKRQLLYAFSVAPQGSLDLGEQSLTLRAPVDIALMTAILAAMEWARPKG